MRGVLLRVQCRRRRRTVLPATACARDVRPQGVGCGFTRCLRVVHGKGLGSPGREPVLKARVQRWLAQSAEVIAFAQASGPQGGAGALMVLLAGSAR